MTESMTANEIIERKIFLKRQLIEITEKEIKDLENKLNDERIENGISNHKKQIKA